MKRHTIKVITTVASDSDCLSMLSPEERRKREQDKREKKKSAANERLRKRGVPEWFLEMDDQDRRRYLKEHPNSEIIQKIWGKTKRYRK